MIWLRKLAMCWWGGCGGTIDYDCQGIRWRCQACGKINRG
jgi:hypothetical protein